MPAPIAHRSSEASSQPPVVPRLPEAPASEMAKKPQSGFNVQDAVLVSAGGASIASAGYMAQVGLGSGGALIVIGNALGVAPSASLIAATIGAGIAYPVAATVFGVHLIREAFRKD